MEERNPYAPPEAEVRAVKDSHCRRDGKFVVVPAGCDLPPRCIVCNAPAAGPVKEVKLQWHSPWLYLLILINILVYVLVGLFARRSVKVSPGLCEVHTAERGRRIRQFVVAGGAAFAAAVGLILADEPSGIIVLLVFALLILIAGMFASRKVYANKITKEYARLGGCKEPFLSSLES